MMFILPVFSTKLWYITGRSSSRGIVPVHNLVDVMEHDVIDILPAVHALAAIQLAK